MVYIYIFNAYFVIAELIFGHALKICAVASKLWSY